MKYILTLFILFCMFSCEKQSVDSPCLTYIESVQHLENQLQKSLDREDKINQELESAKLYIKTLEYENSELLKLTKN